MSEPWPTFAGIAAIIVSLVACIYLSIRAGWANDDGRYDTAARLFFIVALLGLVANIIGWLLLPWVWALACSLAMAPAIVLSVRAAFGSRIAARRAI